MEKSLLRKEMCILRNNVLFTAEKNCQILKKVLKLFEEEKYSSVFSYVSMNSEVDTKGIITSLLGKIDVFVPHTLPDYMFPVRFNGGVSLNKVDRLGNVYECPVDSNIVPQVTITPLLAFNSQLYRLGYGGGYYDKFFAKTSTIRIGLAFDEQEVDNISIDKYDVSLDVIITPTRILRRLT